MGSVNCMIGASLFTSRISHFCLTFLFLLNFSVCSYTVCVRSAVFFFLQRRMRRDTLLVSLLSVCIRVVSFFVVLDMYFSSLCMLCTLVDCTVYWVYVLDIATVVYLTRAGKWGVNSKCIYYIFWGPVRCIRVVPVPVEGSAITI